MAAGMVRTLGLVSPLLREVAAVADHFSAPFVMDITASQRVLGATATSWDRAIIETLAAPAHV